jgi:hypothetical protein
LREKEEEKKKIGARSETVSGKTFATAIENTPREKRARTKPYRSNSRSAFNFFSREVAAERRKNLRPTTEKDYFHSFLVEKKKTTKFALFFARTFRRRSRSWWVRSRRGHFYISRADISADKSCSR